MKTCTRCNCEKPESDFRVKRIGADGVPRLRPDCKACEWGTRSDEARERKRERERGRLRANPEYAARQMEYAKKPERKEYLKRYSASALEKAKQEGLNFKQGRHIFFMVRQCEKCGCKDSLRVKPIGIGGQYCRSCVGAVLNTGRKSPLIECVCADCSNVFTAGSVRAKRCVRCANKYRRGKYGGDTDHRRRARRYGVPYQAINRQMVYERDGWMCYLCGCVVFRSKAYQPNQATIDCVIPMSKGGGYTYSNVKTCCMMCNASKSDRLLEHDTEISEGVRRHRKGFTSLGTSPAHHDVHNSKIGSIFRQD